MRRRCRLGLTLTVTLCATCLFVSVLLVLKNSHIFVSKNDIHQHLRRFYLNSPISDSSQTVSLVKWKEMLGFSLTKFKNENRLQVKGESHHNHQPVKSLPNALVIGVKKAGTRALLEFMRLHPDVRATGSEVHFFDRHFSKGYDWYRQHMPLTLEGQITMEKTPSYFVSKNVPERVYQMNPLVKLLLVVRDPVTRAVSDYTQVLSKNVSVPKFENLAFQNDSQYGLVDTSWIPIRIGVYVRHLERWLHYFPLRQFHFVSGERLIVDPSTEITAVQDFLGLKRVITEKHFYFNTTKGFPCLKKSEAHSSPHCLGKTKGRSHPQIDPAAIERLREFYRPFNLRFYQITGINFGWS